MIRLTILSIFRQSASYLSRYFTQVEQAFEETKGKCHAIWLEGDSTDDTFELLKGKKQQLEAKGHLVTLIKFDLNQTYWTSVKHPKRWLQLATCWNECLKYLQPTDVSICVESDLIWEPQIIQKIIPKLDADHQVIAPMLLLEGSKEVMGEWWFYDTWGFSRGEDKFRRTNPFWKKRSDLRDEGELLQVTTAGGMLVSTYDVHHKSSWDLNACILKYPEGTKILT